MKTMDKIQLIEGVKNINMDTSTWVMCLFLNSSLGEYFGIQEGNKVIAKIEAYTVEEADKIFNDFVELNKGWR